MKKKLFLILCLLYCIQNSQAQNPATGKVVLQAFWKDYWNNNYPTGWFNYLAELAPRLKLLGINAVWIPPAVKNSSIADNGYAPFDNYDLGDKFQKGSLSDPDTSHRLKVRSGDKNEHLRMVAVMHANGIEVIEDIVLNHNMYAGSVTGAGGEDSTAWSDGKSKYKNFRFVCYETPAANETALNYLSRKGRFSKNWQNFHPNPADNNYTTDITRPDFGPDICYEGGYGLSGTAIYNPQQTASYVRDKTRSWLIWYKKQTGFDGVRLDAVKHFSPVAMEDFLYNLQNNADFANGTDNMYAVGEYLDGNPNAGSSTDTWINAVMKRAGTFDYALRYGIKDMVDQSGGAYDLSQIPTKLQYNRNKIGTFVNNFDTFRPLLTTTAIGNGNYSGWDTAQETGGGHIDPKDPRIGAAYAIAMSVDGAPTIWMEDLFNLGYSGKRWTHRPTNTTDLAAMDDVANLIRCHNKLSFKAGAMKWRWQAADHLIIERSGRAIIGVNDNFSTWQSNTIATDFPNNTVLMDYSGSSSDLRTVTNGQINISTPPCNGTAKRKGYSVWAPVGMQSVFNADFAPASKATTQQWELSDDLGDSHKSSLKQGGAIPSNSTALRKAGKILVDANQPVSISLTPSDSTQSLTLIASTCNGQGVDSVSGKGKLTLHFSPSTVQYLNLQARNTYNSNKGQSGVLITATYTAPLAVSTALFGSTDNCVLTGTNQLASDNISFYPNPSTGKIYFELSNNAEGHLSVMDILGKEVHQERILISNGQTRILDLSHLEKGIYFIRIIIENKAVMQKIILS